MRLEVAWKTPGVTMIHQARPQHLPVDLKNNNSTGKSRQHYK